MSASVLKDPAFVNRLIAGDKQAQEQCYHELSPVLFTAILKICGNQSAAEDLLHDTFIDAFRYVGQLDSNANFPAWIKRIAFNNTLNYLNSAKRLLSVAEPFEAPTEVSVAPCQQAENQNLLLVLFKTIPASHRLIVWLFVVEQYTHYEIAEFVGKTPSYSKSIVSRCLGLLRNHQEVKQNGTE